EVGEGVTTVKPGDPVVASLLVACGKCRYCTTGRPHLCSGQWPRDKATPYRNQKGQELVQMTRIGSFAEYTIVDQSQVVKIPADMPLDCASMLACGVITGFGAVVNRARVGVMDACVIVGVGGVGLNAIQGAAISGAYPVIAVDINDAKLEASKTFGATHMVNSKAVDAVEAVKEMTEGSGADYVFVTVGNIAAQEQGFQMSARGGMTVLVGLPSPKDSLNLDAFDFIMAEKILTGSYMGTTNLQQDEGRIQA
ncbi:unnamed protein product, partial [marine sediment metagenome]